jgi:hypothetical protein
MPIVAIGATVIGVLLCLIGAVIDPRRIAAAYLMTYVTCVAVVLGALASIMIARVTAATWFVVLRRQAEQVAAVLPALAVLFIRVLLARVLYPRAAVGRRDLQTGIVGDASSHRALAIWTVT